MTTYNCAPYIGQAIKSILNQSYEDFEFLIIDDGSTDNTEEIISQYNDSRIRYLRRGHFGRSAALNYGLKNASSDTIALMDADDISHPLRLEKQLEVMKGAENVICYTRAAYFQHINFKIRFVNESFIGEDLNRILALHGYFCNSSMIFNKNYFLSSGSYNEKIISGEDYELLLRLKDKSNFIVIPEVLHFPRIRKKSLNSLAYSSKSLVIYNFQKPYYLDLTKSFGISDIHKQNEIKGWREYFYGDKKLCRVEWLKVPLIKWRFRMFIAYLISYIPSSSLNNIKEKRIKLRVEYLFSRRSNYQNLQKEFNRILNSISKN
jgi:glycosyltransferase involved in cell wall biosynthesis